MQELNASRTFFGFGTAVVLMLAVCLTACGDENTTEVMETTGMQVLQTGESMPKCDDDSEGQMVYAVDSAAAFICADGKWHALNSENAKGADGADGVNDKNGTDGTDGNDGDSCTVVALPDSSGYKVLCGGDSVGVMLNGKDGSNGKDGVSCSLNDNGDGTVSVSCGFGDDVMSSTLYKAFCGTKTFDPATHFCDKRDAKVYRCVTIGEQVWMAENLNYDPGQGGSDDEKYDWSWCYENSEENCAEYGRLYTWAAAVDSVKLTIDATIPRDCGYGETCGLTGRVRGICPEGWHLPSMDEWESLIVVVDGSITEYEEDNTAGFKLMSQGAGYSGGNGDDAFGFSALFSGYKYFYNGLFDAVGNSTYFWSSKEYYSYEAFFMYLKFNNESAGLGEGSKRDGNSVRCIKD